MQKTIPSSSFTFEDLVDAKNQLTNQCSEVSIGTSGNVPFGGVINNDWNHANYDLFSHMYHNETDKMIRAFMLVLKDRFKDEFKERGSEFQSYYSLHCLLNELPNEEIQAYVEQYAVAIKMVNDPSQELVYIHHVTHEL